MSNNLVNDWGTVLLFPRWKSFIQFSQCLKSMYRYFLWNLMETFSFILEFEDEFMRLADLPLLADLAFVGNPLQEKCAPQSKWIQEVSKRLPDLKKVDGKTVTALFCI